MHTAGFVCIFCVVGAFAGCASSLDEPQGSATDGSGVAPATGVIFGDDGSGVAAGSDGSGPFDGDVCVGEVAGAESLPSTLELLVDTSGSMDQDAPGSRQSKWTVTRSAVLDAVTTMPAETSLGVTFYPNVGTDNDPCFDRQSAVSIDALGAAGAQQRRAVTRAFQRQAPRGGTPTHDAYRYAISEVLAAPSVGPRYIVLITDGVPTYSLGCVGTGQQQDPVDPTPLIGEAASALSQGIRTFVIGSPGSEGARESLSRMAEAGGTSATECSHTGPTFCHFDMTRERDLATGLSAALDTIAGQALSCQYQLPSAPSGQALDPAQVNVLFSPANGQEELIAQSLDSGCSDGWRYSDDFSQIRLCAATCDRVKSANGSVSLEFGCVTRVR